MGIEATTLEANAAMRSIVRRDTGERYEEFLRGLARPSSIPMPVSPRLPRPRTFPLWHNPRRRKPNVRTKLHLLSNKLSLGRRPSASYCLRCFPSSHRSRMHDALEQEIQQAADKTKSFSAKGSDGAVAARLWDQTMFCTDTKTR
jgi:hypothetical protein